MESIKIGNIEAIDVHGHFGRYQTGSWIYRELMSGDLSLVEKRAKQANTRLTIVSPLEAFFPEPGNPLNANKKAIKLVRNKEAFLLWVVVDPKRPETFEQAKVLISERKCVGIKIHPLLHDYPISKYGGKIFEFAARHNIAVQSHSGQKNCMPDDFIVFANSFPDVKIIISHLGCSDNQNLFLQINAILRSKYHNLFTDTSSFRSIFPGLIELAVENVGADRILYGTDTPLYFAPCQRARIDNADIPDSAKLLILRENALRIFKIRLV
ncbi:MAG: amidohydrolase family protein [Candidatus Omnitrophica bacterium]|nr:amidohydrolase family protein [Candidatus Omnitrophota bacterium]